MSTLQVKREDIVIVVVGEDLHTRDIARDVEVRGKYPHTINIAGGEIL